MLEDPAELSSRLAGGPLGGRTVSVIEMPRAGERVLTVPARPAELLTEWTAARALLEQTGRWPVAATAWSRVPPAPTLETFWLDPRGEKPIPPALRQAAATLTGERAIAEIRAAQREDAEPLEEFLDWHLDATRKRCGAAPDPKAIAAAFADGDGRRSRRWLGHRTPQRPAKIDLERWLLEWEEQVTPTTSPEHVDYDDWFQPDEDDCHLLFLPTSLGSDSLAYLEFYAEDGVEGATTERLIATLASWHDRYGAELVAHWGTMLQFVVTRPPNTLEDAWNLALEHDLVAPCTNALPGETIRDSARMLWRRPRWFLHERP